MRIVVLAGGTSTERDVSISSGILVAAALREKGHEVVLLDVFKGYERDICDVYALFKQNYSFTDAIKVGDTIYTDGRIVYGHIPVRCSVNMSHTLSGIVLSGYQYTIFKDIGHRYSDARCDALDRNTNISNAFNWLYEKDNKEWLKIYIPARSAVVLRKKK